jgi:serine/threonine-protein kinase OSR1/STK39
MEFDLPFCSTGYRKLGRIGHGAFSNVFRARSASSEVAIKVMDLENISTSFEDILQEVQTMR